MHKYLLLLILVSQNCFSENTLESCTDEMLHQYSLTLRKEVSSNITYPELALRRGLEGDVVFNFTLLDGVITEKRIIESTWPPGINSSWPSVINSSLLSSIKIKELPQLFCKTKFKEMNIISKFKFKLPRQLDPETFSLTPHSSGATFGSPLI